MTIALYGSYHPQEEKQLLIQLKNKLIDNGYTSTYLVQDYPRKGESDLEISERSLLFSDVNFLIFTKGGKRLGLVRELAFVAVSEEMVDKAWACVVFDQIVNGESSIPPLSLEDIHNSGIRRREFATFQELEDLAIGTAFWYLKKLAPVLRRRARI